MIPLSDPSREYLELKSEIDAAIQAVCTAGHYILGPSVKAFEQQMAAFSGCPHAVGVANGTDALHLALRALGVGPGDEVITTPFTFVATTEAIGLVGATPVFVDIEPLTFNIAVTQIEEAITPRTRCILPVHLYGQACDMDPIMDIARRHDIFVVEDCAQALGAMYKGRMVGTIGDAGTISFFPSKNLGCFGDGGMVVTGNSNVFERVEMLRRHGGKVKYRHDELGLNSRLDELQAAVLRVKLPYLNVWNQSRRRNAYYYNQLLRDCHPVKRPSELTANGTLAIDDHPDSPFDDFHRSIYHQYTIIVNDRESLMVHLQQQKIGHAVYYPLPLHLQRVHAGLGHRPGAFPVAELIAKSCLSLPMFPGLTEQQQQHVVKELKMALMETAHVPADRRMAG